MFTKAKLLKVVVLFVAIWGMILGEGIIPIDFFGPGAKAKEKQENVIEEAFEIVSHIPDEVSNEDRYFAWYVIDKKKYHPDILRIGMYNFISKYKKAHLDDEYVQNLTNYFMELILTEETADAKLVMYFVALCSVESNFDQDVRNGITQVQYNIHSKYIKELGISKNNFIKSPKHNLLAGYKLLWCAWKANNELYDKATARYNGGGMEGYSIKVRKRYLDLVSMIIVAEKNKNM
jgi:hypothetical protein